MNTKERTIVKAKITESIFSKDFTLVVIGQIISLFGNQILRYAIPLYLLNQTDSAFMFGITMAASFIPMFILSPIGGLIADRVNKRNIMVILDFSTAGLVLIYTLLYSNLNILAVTIIMLMLLYGIQGLYQPTVQASVPILVSKDSLTQGNAVINMVGSLAGILGPVIGGLAFAKLGIGSILVMAAICFVVSAVMEIFINIPFTKKEQSGSAVSIAKEDMKEGIDFITKKRPEIIRVSVLLMVINAVFSALIVVGLPIVINYQLGFEETLANTLYGYSQGALAIGGLLGGAIAGIAGKKLKVKNGAGILLACTISILPIAVCLSVDMNGFAAYAVILLCLILMMIASTMLCIILITYVQRVTPENVLGKVMALLSCLVMCGHPVGQLVYGYFLETFSGHINVIFGAAFVLAVAVTLTANRIFKNLK